MAMAHARIQIRDLRLAFGSTIVLDGVDLDILDRENLVLIGTSGSGKSVLLKCILGLLRPDAGSITLDGHEIIGLGETAREAQMRRFGVLFQRGALFDSLPVWRNVAFGLIEARAMSHRRAKAVALSKLAAVGLDADVAELMPAELSGGMQKRVALARSIATDPEFLLLDDPVAGLDPILTGTIDKVILKCIRELGVTALSIMQDMASVRRLADRIAMLDHGRIIWTGPAATVDESGNPYVDQFVHGRREGPIRLDLAAAPR